MRLSIRALAIAVAAIAANAPASAYTRIHINLSTQTMYVQSSRGSYAWPVSTARAGYVTPRGSYSPKSMKRMHYSRKYHMSPMPHSIFFRGGYAIHGSYETGSLGSPASHGCVRLAPWHAKQLYDMVRSEGGHITISGARPGGYSRVRGPGVHASARSRGRGNYAAPSQAAAGNPFVELFGDSLSW
ncbi:L,D-transpeptidase [Methylocystis sp. ATCC 49242]|uniref:L,D-transpeptidase n=1 Tax=Methylocystis sp. ATCC 49242 TaxID=622637 RepID=UPI0001F87C65|nr:L,D-transpeptidase [Methylocystis sp. ATCC 49242]